jgi:hypothetical protein
MNHHHDFVWTGYSDQRWTNNANWQVLEAGGTKPPAEDAAPSVNSADAAILKPEFFKKHTRGEKA